jgi:ubiquinone/menaquinone biosynthesis C-methylase UbiE
VSDGGSKPNAGPQPTRWERAYQAFDTPEHEFRKFMSRLRMLGADRWDGRCRVLEVCSGRGTGLSVWHALGFRDVLGVDFSFALVAAYRGPGRCVVGDARKLPLPTASRDVVMVQGGLHHLPTFDDVERALAEMCRVVTPQGRIVIIEPWLTPFLHVVHAVTAQPVARRMSAKFDAFAIMREEERHTYEQWLNAPDDLVAIIRRYVAPHLLRRRWGKLVVVGSPAA